MVLIIVFAVLFVVMMVANASKVGVKRCWDAPPGQSKVHHWVIKTDPDSAQMLLVCKRCGQRPGEE